MKTLHTTSFTTCLAALTIAFAPVVRAVILPVAEDTSSTAAGEITASTGKAATLNVGHGSEAFLQFDLTSLPTSLTASNLGNARLNLYVTKAVAPGDLAVYLVTNDWSEATAKEKAPGFETNVIATIPGTNVVAKRFVEADVTAAVEAWLNGTTNFGFAIAGAAGNVALGSKEGLGTGFPALLEIEMAPPSPDIQANSLSVSGSTSLAGAIRVPGAGLETTGAVFIHRATAANTLGNWTDISNPLCDGDSNAIVFVTQNWNPGGPLAAC
jgi:hypothetical protein